jgi:nickel-dependent lactate racemase
MEITLAYGRTGLDAKVPDRHVRHVLRFTPLEVLQDPGDAVRQALHSPIGCPLLRELATGKADACIVTSDITRPVPNALILPVVLQELGAAGVPPEGVVILIATGSHRPNTSDELREMLGDEAMASGARIVNHDAQETQAAVHRGKTKRGTPVWVNRWYVEAGLRVSVSLVEPHLIAGFSGGRKQICPGICGIETILHFHAPELVLPDEACAGLLEGNPAHEESLEATRMAGPPEVTVNVTLDEARQVTGIFAGELEAAHRAAAARSVAQSKASVPAPVDIAITTGAGYPLDLTFYQSVKGLAAPVPILKPGGTIIAACECAEGIGEPDLERRIMELDEFDTYQPMVWDPAYFHMDQWHAQYSKIRRRAGEVLVRSDGVPRAQLEQCFVTPIDSVEEGVDRALAAHGPDATIAVIPEGAYVLPCIEGDRIDRQHFATTC